MNQTKFTLADVLTLLTALTFGFVCFLGTNFFTLGETWQSIILAVIITVLLAGTALGAKTLRRTSRNFKFCFICEIVLIVLFTCFMLLFSYSPFPHYFTVAEQREVMQPKLAAGIEQAENMFAAYELYADNREHLYRSNLRSVVQAKNINPSAYSAYGFDANSVPDATQIDNKMFTLHADLFPTNYVNMKQEYSAWLAKARNSLNNWWAWNFGVVDVVNNVESNSQSWLNTLIGFSKVRETGEQANDFDYALSFANVKTHFQTLGSPTPLTIGLSALACLLMLLSYFITKRHTRFPGLKLLFGKDEIYFDNEL
jgi:hypothetical protein